MAAATPSDVTIPKRRDPGAAPDHQPLFAAGLERLRALAGAVWTDHNVHDPGITTLELLCYALTDLVYRASFPVGDLLAGSTADATAAARAQFFTAREILPTRPLTLADYRKLLIDVPGVKNAWLRPHATSLWADTVTGTLLRAAPPAGTPGVVEVPLRGLYDVRIEYMEEVTSAEARERVDAEARRQLQANRTLCEDFVGLDAVATTRYVLCGEVEVDADADIAAVQAEMLHRVDAYLSPPVRQHSLAEMRATVRRDGTRWRVEEIFSGPALAHGFVDDDELARAELREEIRLSDVVGILMDVPGVRAVRDVVIQRADAASPPEDRWRVPVPDGTKPLLDTARSRLVFYKREMPFVADRARVAARLAELARAASAFDRDVSIEDLPVPLGRFRAPATYHSVQNHFPALYGLSEAGLVGSTSGAAGARRQALADQLKGYLLFFDQVMADFLAQLARVGDLFAFRAPPGAPAGAAPPTDRTDFHQVVTSFRDWRLLYADAAVGGGTDDDAAARAAAALEALDDPAQLVARRNRFLDHLIARVAEDFRDFVHVMQEEFGATPASVIPPKLAFLRDYPATSAARGTAYDQSRQDDAGLWNSDNVSGLERRLAGLLAIPNASRRNLGDVAYDVYAEVDATPGDEFRFRVRRRDTGKIVLSGSTRYATPAAAREEMRRAIRRAADPSAYQRRLTEDGRHYFNVVDGAGEVIARRIEYFATEALLDAAIAELVAYVRAEYSDEGMYVIENLLLRPERDDDPLLPICPDPSCAECADEDPYSYRIHVILPAYGARFDDMEFRRWAEEVIRAEVPAHVQPKVCWISKEDMAALERLYRDWIFLRAGRERADRTRKLAEFIAALFRVKNVYPAQRLSECVAPEKFLLGRSALGTA